MRHRTKGAGERAPHGIHRHGGTGRCMRFIPPEEAVHHQALLCPARSQEVKSKRALWMSKVHEGRDQESKAKLFVPMYLPGYGSASGGKTQRISLFCRILILCIPPTVLCCRYSCVLLPRTVARSKISGRAQGLQTTHSRPP
jgi:hypothetical protein